MIQEPNSPELRCSLIHEQIRESIYALRSVKSLCPGDTVTQWPGQSVAGGELTSKTCPQLSCMKPESLVIAGHPCGGEFVDEGKAF